MDGKNTEDPSLKKISEFPKLLVTREMQTEYHFGFFPKWSD